MEPETSHRLDLRFEERDRTCMSLVFGMNCGEKGEKCRACENYFQEHLEEEKDIYQIARQENPL